MSRLVGGGRLGIRPTLPNRPDRLFQRNLVEEIAGTAFERRSQNNQFAVPDAAYPSLDFGQSYPGDVPAQPLASACQLVLSFATGFPQ